MKITIVGGGNIGTQFAVHCAEKKHEVTIYTSTPELFDKHISIVDNSGKIIHEGTIFIATNDPEEAFSHADLIIVTFPATMMDTVAELIYEYGNKKTVIGVVPGNGGSECAFRKCIERGNSFFGIERVPAIARLVKKGKTVRSTGYRNELHVASIPYYDVDKCCKLIHNIFDIPCKPILNYLNLTLTPSNPILHTTRLFTLFKDYHEGIIYTSIPLFYEEWDNDSSQLLMACDDEVQNICRALPEFHLEYVKSLREHYESQTVEAMTEKISGIIAFKGIKTPAVKVKGGFIPDLHSRYFTADFSYGLAIIKQIAIFAGVSTPHIDLVNDWYKSIAIEKDEFNFMDYSITSLNDLKRFYSK